MYNLYSRIEVVFYVALASTHLCLKSIKKSYDGMSKSYEHNLFDWKYDNVVSLRTTL